MLNFKKIFYIIEINQLLSGSKTTCFYFFPLVQMFLLFLWPILFTDLCRSIDNVFTNHKLLSFVLNFHNFFYLAAECMCKLKKESWHLIFLYCIQITSPSQSVFAKGIFVSRSWSYLLVSFIYGRPDCSLLSSEFS